MQRSSSFVKESRGGALGCSQARVPGACLTAPRSKSTITRSPIAAALATILGGEARGGAAVWDCVGGGGGCAGGGVPMGAVPVLPWCGEVSLGGRQSSSARVGAGGGTEVNDTSGGAEADDTGGGIVADDTGGGT